MFIPTDTMYDLAAINRRERLIEAANAGLVGQLGGHDRPRIALVGRLRRSAGVTLVRWGALLHGGFGNDPARVLATGR